jgi:hypothetical protein
LVQLGLDDQGGRLLLAGRIGADCARLSRMNCHHILAIFQFPINPGM